VRLLVTALTVVALVLVGCSHEKELKESPGQVRQEQLAADAHNAGTTPSTGDDEDTAATTVPGPTTTEVEYEGAQFLRIGDCVDIPRYNVASVHAIPCSQPHHSEVTERIDVRQRFGLQYPTEADFDHIRDTDCAQAFEAYTGHGATAEIVPGQLVPTTAGWNEGDRTVTCVAEPSDNREGNILVGSVRKPA
jgi:hypothetical protein